MGMRPGNAALGLRLGLYFFICIFIFGSVGFYASPAPSAPRASLLPPTPPRPRPRIVKSIGSFLGRSETWSVSGIWGNVVLLADVFAESLAPLLPPGRSVGGVMSAR